MEKRESCRAIIFSNDKLITMYREKNNRIYYTFPGGGKEKTETLNECVIREAKEEFGIDVKPLREVYLYENANTIQHFLLCEWTSGEFGSGVGEEFQGDTSRGKYIPTLLDIDKLGETPLMPPEVTAQIIKDIKTYGYKLSNDVKSIIGE